MSYQVLARKWRPGNFKELVGQEHVVQALVNALDSERLHHAYLFTGTRGVGKTTIARIFAKSLNCDIGISSEPCGECASCLEVDEGRSIDLIEIDAASRTGVDDMRELLDNVQYAPTRGRFKIYLVDEVHMLSRHSFNALLKTLEEPPPHIKFLLATTDPQKLPVTVLSRCLQFNLKRMSKQQILSHLQYLLGQEKVKAETTAMALLASAADGSMRDGLSLLDQAIAIGGGSVSLGSTEAMLGTISRDYLVKLFDSLLRQDAVCLVEAARNVIEHNPDYQRVCSEMISLLHQMALYQSEAAIEPEDDWMGEQIVTLSARISSEEIQLYYQIMLQGRRDLSISPDAAVGFEMLMLRLLAFSPDAGAVTQTSIKKKPVIRQQAPEDNIEQGPIAGVSQSIAPEQADPPRATAEVSRASDSIEWSVLAYDLGLQGLAQEIVINSIVASYDQNHLCLKLQPEILELANATMRGEITQAIDSKLGVSLKLDLQAQDQLEVETPQQARIREQEEQRQAAIDAIRQENIVQKLHQAFGAELVESSVKKID